jgi:hypothetical protein
MVALVPTIRAAPVGARQFLMGTASLRNMRLSGSSDGAAPAPSAPPSSAPAGPPADPAPAALPSEAPQPGEPKADPTKPKKPDELDADSDATPADGGPPADPAEVADVCARAGQGTLASTFIRARASMAVVRAGLRANGAVILARFNWQPEPRAQSSTVRGGSPRLDASTIFNRMNAPARQSR